MSEPVSQASQAPPTLTEVAASAAHALNNTVGVLFAASSYLEMPGPSGMERATRAVADATAGARALSAALTVLAIGPHDIEAARRQPANRFGDDELARLREAMSEVGAVRWAKGEAPQPATMLQLDAHTLQSVLVCAAWCLRRSAAQPAVVEGWLEVAGPTGKGELSVRLESVQVAPAAAGGRLHHPSEWALGHAGSVLAPLGLTLDVSQPGRVELRCRPGGA